MYVYEKRKRCMAKGKDNGANLGFEAKLCKAADTLRSNVTRLVAQLQEQQAEAAKLDKAIAKKLKELGYGE
jgi:hypothetical protein